MDRKGQFARNLMAMAAMGAIGMADAPRLSPFDRMRRKKKVAKCRTLFQQKRRVKNRIANKSRILNLKRGK